MIGQEIHVWRLEPLRPDANPDELKDWLSEDERKRALQFHFARDRTRFIVTRAALREILSAILGSEPGSLQFATGPYGKPVLMNHELQFNVSHSGAMALIAVARDRELGVDIEEMRQLHNPVAIAKRFFAPEEAQQIDRITNAGIRRAFFECWTRKEAFIKAIGEGLSHPLDSFRVTFFPEEIAELRVHSEKPGQWLLVDLNVGPGYCAALVFEQYTNDTVPRIIQHEWEPPSYRGDCHRSLQRLAQPITFESSVSSRTLSSAIHRIVRKSEAASRHGSYDSEVLKRAPGTLHY
jgi:4'-phosphopantetheinyl transferase